ncbi:MAG TPA: SsrA-binding protein SmpB [Candidatus Limnocylindria bacterium]|nr:SsrA-binding protein SmpB [Candidatus Limnocylindria bacterium]
MEQKERPLRTVADNRRARFDYHIDSTIEAGIALTGPEIKSVRAGRIDIRDGYARIDRGEAWLRNVRITPWESAHGFEEQDPTRPRKLLLHREEIGTLAGSVSQKGYTIVPLRVYLRRGVAKVELGLARGKKKYDKREAIKAREHAREIQAAASRARRG